MNSFNGYNDILIWNVKWQWQFDIYKNIQRFVIWIIEIYVE